MRRSASEVIRELEMRIARLERQSVSSLAYRGERELAQKLNRKRLEVMDQDVSSGLYKDLHAKRVHNKFGTWSFKYIGKNNLIGEWSIISPSEKMIESGLPLHVIEMRYDSNSGEFNLSPRGSRSLNLLYIRGDYSAKEKLNKVMKRVEEILNFPYLNHYTEAERKDIRGSFR